MNETEQFPTNPVKNLIEVANGYDAAGSVTILLSLLRFDIHLQKK